jgi:YD repeat-containing protein
MRRMVAVGVASLFAMKVAMAQNTLGELLDAGAAKLSPAEFQQEVVGRPIAGATPAGTRLELMYIGDGRIVGAGFATVTGGLVGGAATYAINGAWTVDGTQRICTRIRVDLPSQCQFWFRNGELFFLTDSDWDRESKVTRRSMSR